jgi:cbb3-type cytochrome oxidase subunit 1
MENNHASAWLKIAALYFVAGVALGLHMAKSGNHSMHALHAHINLLGWVSMALFGLIYRQFPSMAGNTLAKAHFWLYNLALPVQMVTLYMFLDGNAGIEPVLGIASTVAGFAIALFAVNAVKNAK